MKKFTAILLMLVLCVGLLTGCGASYDAEESTVFVLKDGKIVSTDVESFDEDTYDEEKLKTYVEEAIAEYVEENGEDTVKLKELTVKEGKATLILEYADAGHYTRFNGIELFSGSMAEALAAGYTFDVDFASVDDGKAAECDRSEFYENDDYKVAIIKANTNVKIKGTIYFVSSANVALVDKSTISIKPGNSLLSAAVESTESEDVTETIDGEEVGATETDAVDDGSVGEDELLTGEEESTEIVFDFGEEETEETDSEFSSVYTYIIYK